MKIRLASKKDQGITVIELLLVYAVVGLIVWFLCFISPGYALIQPDKLETIIDTGYQTIEKSFLDIDSQAYIITTKSGLFRLENKTMQGFDKRTLTVSNAQELYAKVTDGKAYRIIAWKLQDEPIPFIINLEAH